MVLPLLELVFSQVQGVCVCVNSQHRSLSRGEESQINIWVSGKPTYIPNKNLELLNKN